MQVPLNLAEHEHLRNDMELAFKDAMVSANAQLHASDVDDSMSGTTAVTCLLRGRTAFVANVGDSRALMAERGAGEILTPCPLSRDQTPFRYPGAQSFWFKHKLLWSMCIRSEVPAKASK